MGPDRPGSRMLIDLDDWARERYKGSLDFLMFGSVSGLFDV